jgi:hypothetical protein
MKSWQRRPAGEATAAMDMTISSGPAMVSLVAAFAQHDLY